MVHSAYVCQVLWLWCHSWHNCSLVQAVLFHTMQEFVICRRGHCHTQSVSTQREFLKRNVTRLCMYTLKNKGASRCHRVTFLSKWFHKEPLTSDLILFHKRFFVAKEVSDYKKVRKRWIFKEHLTEWFFVETKMVLLWHRFEEPFEAPLFLRV